MAKAAAGQTKLQPVEEQQADQLITQARRLLYTGTLAEVAANRAEVNLLIEQASKLVGYGSIPEDIWDMVAALDEIVAGKVDRVAALVKQGIPAQRAALTAAYTQQDERLALAEARLGGLLAEAVKIAGKPLSGHFWKARLQDNSQPSVVVTDPAAVPAGFKRRRFTLSFDYPVSAKVEKLTQAVLAFWGGDKAAVMGVTGAKGSVVDNVPAKPIVDHYKATETVPAGIFLEQGQHLRLEPVKGKPGVIAQPTPLKLADKT